jgi:hypothetical protein
MIRVLNVRADVVGSLLGMGSHLGCK